MRAAARTSTSCKNSVEFPTYLLEHIVDDEKQIYDLGSNNEDVEAAWRLVEADALQLAGKLERSCRNKSVWVSEVFLTPCSLVVGFLPTAAVSNSSVTTQKRLTLAL